jgi:predicted RNA-binding protein (virulence factor B family)
MESLLGRVAALVVKRIDAEAVWLMPRQTPEQDKGQDKAKTLPIPLPVSELPEGEDAKALKVGASVTVFVYLDSEDRPITTTRTPKITLGEVDFLMVTDLAPFGAFVSWGLKKDLLVPHREQVRRMRVGERHAVGLYIDDTGRLAGTTRVSEMLRAAAPFSRDAWVPGVAWREEAGLGLFVILEKKYLALLPSSEPHRLYPGDAARFRVAHMHPDGKTEVSLRGLKHEEMEADAARLLEVLRAPRPPRLGDATPPERIRSVLGISKKAFKRAAGRLLKMDHVEIDPAGFLRAKERARRPG